MKSLFLSLHWSQSLRKQLQIIAYNATIWFVQASREAWADDVHPEYEMVTPMVIFSFFCTILAPTVLRIFNFSWWVSIPAGVATYLLLGGLYYLLFRKRKKDPVS